MASTNQVEPGMTVPAWTLGDRLRKARESAGHKQPQFAELIGISTRSVSSYEGDKLRPKRPVLLSWALACGVPLGWLVDGTEPGGGPSGPDNTGEQAGLPTGR